MSAAKRKSSGVNAAMPKQKSFATGERVALDRGELSEIFRRVARHATQLADYSNRLADNFARPAANTPTHPARREKGKDAA